MLFAAVVATAVACSRPDGPAPRLADVQIVRRAPNAKRYVGIVAASTTYGVPGTTVERMLLGTRYAWEKTTAGVVTNSDGFDGSAWTADATGMPLEVDGDAARDAVAANDALYGWTPPRPVSLICLRTRDGAPTVRIRYPGLPSPIDITLDRATGRVVTVRTVPADDPSPATTTFGDYRTRDGITLPWRTSETTRYGTQGETVRSVVTRAQAPRGAFARPHAPDDATLDGVASIPMTTMAGVPEMPMIRIVVDGAALNVGIDTGSTDYLSPRAAKRIGLHGVPGGGTGGVGPGVVPERLATASDVRIATARISGLPFAILDDGGAKDGSVGCEVLQRFAMRLDFATMVVSFARDVAALHPHGRAIPLRLPGCTPEADGSLDGMVGAFGIDTGSEAALDVMSPYVASRHLLARYKARKKRFAGSGIGGSVVAYAALAKTVCIATTCIDDLPIDLNTIATGAFADATELGNIGVPFLFRYTVTFDYRTHRMWLE